VGADGRRTLIFDADGTRVGVRHRAVPNDADSPRLHRRSAKATAPGYLGRKRGEQVRSRMTVQQRHTGEWLGTFGHAGNGDALARITAICKAIVSYVNARDLSPSAAVVRVDGEHGWLHHVARIREHGLGYLLRCCDYQILHDTALHEALAAGAIVRIRHADSGIERELFDISSYTWSSLRAPPLRTRLVIARRCARPGEPVSVGKLLHGWIYELIVTDRTAAEWDVAKVFSLYQERGSFEGALAQEDEEMTTDRWVCFHPQGQEFWQILCQWVWNLRLRLSAEAHDARAEGELVEPDAEATRGEPVVLAPAPSTAESSQGQSVAPSDSPAKRIAADAALGDDTTRMPTPSPSTRVEEVRHVSFGTGHFTRIDANAVVCPANVTMHASERVARREGPSVRYQAPPKICARCEHSMACRGHARVTAHGHRITLPVLQEGPTDAPLPVRSRTGHALRPPPSLPTAAAGPRASFESNWRPTPLRLETLRGHELRRLLHDALRGHRIELRTVAPLVPPPPPPPKRRAHRRCTWLMVWSRNMLRSTRYSIRLAGIPESLANALGLSRAAPG